MSRRPSSATFERDLASLVGNAVPVLIVRCAHRCRLASVYRAGDRLVMAGMRRDLVETGGRRLVQQVPFIVADLDAPEGPVAFGCRHSSGELLDTAAVSAAARAATRLREDFVIS